MLKYSLLSLALLCALVFSPSVGTADDGLALFSAEEAKELNLSDEEWEMGVAPKALNIGVGPKIVVLTPSPLMTEKGPTIKSKPQLSLLVNFKNGAFPVDMSTLTIKAKKGWFSKNLTKRLKPYLDGTTLKAESLKIPTGRFNLEVAISDSEGHETEQTYRCEINE